MNKLLQYYQIFCNLSLDVVLGVICSMVPLPAVLGVQMPLTWYIVLPLCTWIIYLADHVIDVTRLKEEYPSPRHRFIKKHLLLIITLIILISVYIGWQVLHHLSKELILGGTLLCLVVLVHFIIVRINPSKRTWFNNKELAVSFVYATGIYIGPLSGLSSGNEYLPAGLYLYGCFFLVTFVNLLMASIIEYKWDVQMKNASWVRSVGLKNAEKLLYALIVVVIAASFPAIMILDAPARVLYLTYLIIAAGHLLIYKNKDRLENHLLYRKLAEALFWLPAAVIFFV